MQISRRNFINAGLLGATGVALNASDSVLGAAVQNQLGLVQIPQAIGFDERETTLERSKAWTPVSDRKIRVGVAGFGPRFSTPLFGFQSHPNVEVVAVADLVKERCDKLAAACKCAKQYDSLEKMVEDDSIEAVFVATDAPSHAEHAIRALECGKHVACAVPAVWGARPDQADRLYETVKKTGLKYGLFEPAAFCDGVYACRKIYKAGGFGELQYVEGESRRLGVPYAPAMWNPSSAVAYYTCVTGLAFTEVSAWRQPSFQTNKYYSGNPFGAALGTEVAVFTTAEGGVARVTVGFDVFGTMAKALGCRGRLGAWSERSKYSAFADKTAALLGNVNLLQPALPTTFNAAGRASYGQLTNDFIEAILLDVNPLVNVAVALNSTVCGHIAHESALRCGEALKVPQYAMWS
ncbi:MAG: Gfo/Idh/MocA family oxidoreductase [Thermoguttaceae bacterium]|nr:Gfo/Idh/MocA family oxidoreductase [Thermoguttaceae bacterium]